MRDVQLSRNFRLAEFVRSQTASRKGIDNTPDAEAINNLHRLCALVLQPLRDDLGPVYITSGYRCEELNRAIGGSATSQHCAGLAADIVVTGYGVDSVCAWLASHRQHDQLIWEYGEWTHVSIAAKGVAPRRQELTATRGRHGVVYSVGLPA